MTRDRRREKGDYVSEAEQGHCQNLNSHELQEQH